MIVAPKLNIRCQKSVKNSAGFTLIETLIYLALFGIMMGGITVVTYGLIESAGKNQTKILVQEEAGFLLGKLNWALTGASGMTVSPSSLTVNKFGFASNPLVFNVSGTKSEERRVGKESRTRWS